MSPASGSPPERREPKRAVLRRSLAVVVLASLSGTVLLGASPLPVPKPPPAPAAAAPAARNDYANTGFTAPLGQGLRAFYARDFPGDLVKMQIVRHKISHEDACGQAAPAKQ